MVRRFHKTLIDYLVVAISPVLIMTLIGSLVFFLLEIFYRGNFQGRLHYIFALFVVGTVLIGRISIEEGRERAALFAVPLGIAMLLAINKFVEFQGASLSFLINCGLIGVVWWSADKLTWDCTLIDESEDDSGEGLLETVGLDRPGKAALQREIMPLPLESTTVREEQVRSWWGRFVERRRRPHAPGVWVVYFSLAAVALFGVGQLFIPANDLPSRQYAFQLLCVYTASGLGLLLTTSFLGLRRYLRQRRQEMPLSMVNLWLIFGAAVIVVVMLATMFLPRPNPEYTISKLPFRVGSPDQKSSPHGKGHEAVKEQKPWSQSAPDKDRQSASVPSERSDGKSSSGPKNPPHDGRTSADTKKDDTQTSSQDRNESERPSSDSSGSKGSRDQSEPSDSSPSGRSSTQKTADTEDAKTTPDENREPRRDGDRGAGSPPSSPDFQRWLHGASKLLSPTFFKWLVYGTLILIAVFSIWTHRLQLLAALRNFRQRLLDFWHGLFGGAASQTDSAAREATLAKTPRRFSDFTDPFVAGLAAVWPSEKLVRYTFEALEAWARDHGCPRQAAQTPHEFTRRLASNISLLADDARLLADLYCQAAYASGTLPEMSIARLSHLWQNLTRSKPNP